MTNKRCATGRTSLIPEAISEEIPMDDIRQMYRAAPGMVVTVATLLAIAALLGVTALLVS